MLSIAQKAALSSSLAPGRGRIVGELTALDADSPSVEALDEALAFVTGGEGPPRQPRGAGAAGAAGEGGGA